ncbi:MAG: hypothetical protein H7123_00615 [Thermoleophilia bacterium]|nr:hypothetical protein [Thermoleophilia bacterium]
MALPITSASPTVVRTSPGPSPAVSTAAANATRGNATIATGYSSTPATTGAGSSNTTSLQAAANAAHAAQANSSASPLAAAARASTGVPVGTAASSALTVGGQAITNATAGVAALNTNTVRALDTITSGVPQSIGVQHDVKDAISALTAFAQGKMDNVKANIKALMASEGGADSQLNAAKLQQYSQELATFESMMQMAAKMQEQEDQAIKIWVRP